MHIRRLDPGIDLLALKAVDGERYPLLLESSAQALEPSARSQARFDLLLVANGERLVAEMGQVRDQGGQGHGHEFLAKLGAWFDRLRQPRPADEPPGQDGLPFRGGWALFLPYELAGEIEPSLRLPKARDWQTRPLALRCPAAVLRDHATGELLALAEAGSGALLDGVEADLRRVGPLPTHLPRLHAREAPPGEFLHGVVRAQQHLLAGDSYQINLSRGWRLRGDSPIDPVALQSRLRSANPAPFSGLFTFGDWAVASSSPERLVSIRGNRVEARPIAGTRPRLAGDAAAARISELLEHPKERAEHVMLVDLMRNDLGRIAAPASVQVDELMTIESFAHVHHIVSNVSCQLRADATPMDVIRAVFPGGTITGAPKVRTMQLIAELEGEPRGAYTGAMGWLGREGDMDLNILIRSIECTGPELRFRTGAGIVLGSQAQAELDETRAKARGLLRALGLE